MVDRRAVGLRFPGNGLRGWRLEDGDLARRSEANGDQTKSEDEFFADHKFPMHMSGVYRGRAERS